MSTKRGLENVAALRRVVAGVYPSRDRAVPILPLVGAVLCVLVAGPLSAQTPSMPPITVEGRPVTCSGSACFGVATSLYLNPPPPPLGDEFASITPDIALAVFCGELNQANPQPGTCSVSHPPSTPEFDGSWQSNGCGTGSFAEQFVAEIASLGGTWTGMTGNPDAPLPGVSFSGACRSHDRCYTTLESRLNCDEVFRVEVRVACGLASPDYVAGCQELAGLFGNVVSTFGAAAYNQAQLDRACAAWARDMEENGCTQ